jgi:hypothetical protein
MDQYTLRAISNDYQDVRLVSLKGWKRSDEIVPRDYGGPYVVVQEGYDPEDLEMDYDEFLLGKSGEWISVCVFFRLPVDLRMQEFVFGTAAEVIGLMENLTGKARIYRKGESLAAPEADASDELSQIFLQSKGQTTPPPG